MSEEIEKQTYTKTHEGPKPTKESFEEICRILNKPRPYRLSDSIRQHFIPDLYGKKR